MFKIIGFGRKNMLFSYPGTLLSFLLDAWLKVSPFLTNSLAKNAHIKKQQAFAKITKPMEN